MEAARKRIAGRGAKLPAVLMVVGVVAALTASAGGAAASTVERGGLGETLDSQVERAHEERGFSGSVLVAKEGEVALNKGYGLADDEERKPATADTVFGVASLAKQFTSAAILKLEERGELGVRDPISEHLEGVPPDKAGITLHQLLTHTSGLAKNHSESDFEEMGRREALARIFAEPLARAPGSGYEYSDSGYAVVAAIVEEVSGRPFDDFLRENLFEPAGMGRTGFWDDPRFDRLSVANGYTNGVEQGFPTGFPGPSWAIVGPGGILSTTGDLRAWWTALEGNVVLSEESTDKLFGRHVRLGEGEYYGYGWEVSDTDLGTLITHNGAGNTGNAFLAAYPERDLVVAVLSNRVTFRGLTFGGLLEDDDLPYHVVLPADETGAWLAESAEGGALSGPPGATLPLWLTLGGLGTLATVSTGATALALRLTKKLRPRKKTPPRGRPYKSGPQANET